MMSIVIAMSMAAPFWNAAFVSASASVFISGCMLLRSSLCLTYLRSTTAGGQQTLKAKNTVYSYTHRLYIIYIIHNCIYIYVYAKQEKEVEPDR